MDANVQKILRFLSRAVDEVQKTVVEKISPLLQKHQMNIQNNRDDIQALYESQEMMMHVMIRAQTEGLFEGKDLTLYDHYEQVTTRLNELQDEYLVCIALDNFLTPINDPTS